VSWLRFSDDWNNQPEIRALDDAAYRAFRCLIEAAENFGHDGIVTDDYTMGTYPHHDRRKLRNQIRKLAERGLVHLLDTPATDDPCPACAARAEDTGGATRKLRGKLGGLAVTTKRTANMLICICDFFDHALMPEQKEHEKQKARERQQRKRERDREGMSRRDGKGCHAPPDPEPDPDPNTITNKEADTTPTESGDPSPPSPSSNGAAKTPAGSKLQREYGERWQPLYGRPFRWTPAHLDALAEIEAKAAETPELVQPALDAFFADEEQRRFKHIPAGLLMHWKRYVAGPTRRLDAQQRQLRNAERDLRYYQELARAGDRPAPMSLAELEPRYLEEMRGKYPGLDLSQVRSRPRAVPAKTEPKPEQRSNSTPGNVADDPELAKYLI
jgi:hypothetical protein